MGRTLMMTVAGWIACGSAGWGWETVAGSPVIIYAQQVFTSNPYTPPNPYSSPTLESGFGAPVAAPLVTASASALDSLAGTARPIPSASPGVTVIPAASYAASPTTTLLPVSPAPAQYPGAPVTYLMPIASPAVPSTVTYRPVLPAMPAYPTHVTYRPVAAQPIPAEYRVGQGLVGQPKLYVPGQPVRNFLRYLTP